MRTFRRRRSTHRRRRCDDKKEVIASVPVLLLMTVLLSLVCTRVAAQSSQSSSSGGGQGSGNNYPPPESEGGGGGGDDRDEGSSYYGDRDPDKPCRRSSSFNNSNSGTRPPMMANEYPHSPEELCDSSDGGDDDQSDDHDDYNGIFQGEDGFFYLQFNLFISLPPDQRSMGHVFKPLVTNLIRAIFGSISFDDHDDNTTDFSFENISYHNESNYNLNNDTNTSRHLNLDVHWATHKYPRFLFRDFDRWWWKYPFRYECIQPNTNHTPIDLTTFKFVQEDFVSDMTILLANLKEEILEHSHRLYGDWDEELKIQLEEPTPSNDTMHNNSLIDHEHDCEDPPCYFNGPNGNSSSYTDNDDYSDGSPAPAMDDSTSSDGQNGHHHHANGPPPPPQNSTGSPLDSSNNNNDPTTTAQYPEMDLEDWDWKRYLGLALLVGTISGTFCLAQLADLRRERRRQRELWGNLATEEGVDELLRARWKIEGSQMQVYYSNGSKDGSHDHKNPYAQQHPDTNTTQTTSITTTGAAAVPASGAATSETGQDAISSTADSTTLHHHRPYPQVQDHHHDTLDDHHDTLLNANVLMGDTMMRPTVVVVGSEITIPHSEQIHIHNNGCMHEI